MVLIEKILIDDDLHQVKFACDLEKCKGACCTFEGDYGAPVADSEVAVIKSIFEKVKPYLSGKSLKVIEAKGCIEGTPGNYSTVSINNRDCVFVYWENEIARCAIEKAYFDGKIKFRKPLSCHLFPIRVNEYGNPYLYYQKIDECKPAVKRGAKENIYLIDFLKEPIIRAYGKECYSQLQFYSKKQLDSEK